MTDTKTLFPKRLKKLRLKFNYTQSEIAQKLGTTQGAYQKWESGQREPSFYNLIQLASLFHTTTSYLLGEIDDDYAIQKFSSKEMKLSKEEMRNLIFGFIIMADINNTSVDQIIKENSKDEFEYETFKQIYQDTIDKFKNSANDSGTTDTK